MQVDKELYKAIGKTSAGAALLRVQQRVVQQVRALEATGVYTEGERAVARNMALLVITAVEEVMNDGGE